MIVTILDYGAGNLHSLAKAIAQDDVGVRIETDARLALRCDVLVLPGVGSFGFAAAQLERAHTPLRDAIDGGLPVLGICLGMQLLFDSSEEGAGAGLGVLQGTVTRLHATRLPHIGWNTIDDVRDRALIDAGLRSAYYANSFVCRTRAEDVVAWSTHETDRFAAAVRRGRIAGMQFHPEKSSQAGVAALRATIREIAA